MPSAVASFRRRATRDGLNKERGDNVFRGIVHSTVGNDSDNLSSSEFSTSSFDGPIVDVSGEKVLLDDHELFERANDVKTQIDFDTLTDLSKCQWKWKHSKNDFTLFTRQVEHTANTKKAKLTSHQVLAAGEIQCSIEEIEHILQSTSDTDYNAVMKGLYKKDYIYGSIVHVAPGASPSPGTDDDSKSTTTMVASSDQLTVKTSSFVRSNIFVRNEQWCFLEHFQRDPSNDSFMVTITSLDESAITVGKVKHGRVDQLHDLIAGYSVSKIPSTNSVRVLFHGNFSGDNTDPKGNASESMSKSRLMALAKGVSEMPDVVRRRRLGMQKLADRAAFAAKNAHCICCTKSLHLLSKKKRCYLCGYFVCDKDWSIQKMETRHGQVTAIRVCSRCLESVESCEYAGVRPDSLGKVTVKPDQDNSQKAGKAMATFLQDALHNSTEFKKESVKTVIKHLINEERRRSDDSIPPVVLSNSSAEKEYIKALDQYFMVESIPADKCELANNETRAYPIQPRGDPYTPVDYPVPDQEGKRLSAIEKGELMQMSNADELNIICTLAARELNCMASCVTIIGQENQLVLASNVDEFRMLSVPRNETFCQHTIMDTKPLLVPHPEADVRFANLATRKEYDVKFYCGFPIVDQSNAVVGSVCCMDNKTHDLTASQYSSMKRLAETASKVVRMKSQQRRASAAV
uniref:FYVE-type domain-containing protein n=1 Tax=Globisporangium ultimum (strain ATCC 200006 / CBS 805.95 / DAOM BR144) TaxID=431595 RepID=K3W8E9_GLOUD